MYVEQIPILANQTWNIFPLSLWYIILKQIKYRNEKSLAIWSENKIKITSSGETARKLKPRNKPIIKNVLNCQRAHILEEGGMYEQN